MQLFWYNLQPAPKNLLHKLKNYRNLQNRLEQRMFKALKEMPHSTPPLREKTAVKQESKTKPTGNRLLKPQLKKKVDGPKPQKGVDIKLKPSDDSEYESF